MQCGYGYEHVLSILLGAAVVALPLSTRADGPPASDLRVDASREFHLAPKSVWEGEDDSSRADGPEKDATKASVQHPGQAKKAQLHPALVEVNSEFIAVAQQMMQLSEVQDTYLGRILFNAIRGISDIAIGLRYCVAIIGSVPSAVLLASWFKKGHDGLMAPMMGFGIFFFTVGPLTRVFGWLVKGLVVVMEIVVGQLIGLAYVLVRHPFRSIRLPYLMWRQFRAHRYILRNMPQLSFDPTLPLRDQLPPSFVETLPQVWSRELLGVSRGTVVQLDEYIAFMDGSPSKFDRTLVGYAKARRDLLRRGIEDRLDGPKRENLLAREWTQQSL
jgi:hypothetical protein